MHIKHNMREDNVPYPPPPIFLRWSCARFDWRNAFLPLFLIDDAALENMMVVVVVVVMYRRRWRRTLPSLWTMVKRRTDCLHLLLVLCSFLSFPHFSQRGKNGTLKKKELSVDVSVINSFSCHTCLVSSFAFLYERYIGADGAIIVTAATLCQGNHCHHSFI